MIPRKHSSLVNPSFSVSKKVNTVLPVWAFVGIGLVALMGLSYAQVAGVLHHPGEINWNAIITNPILVGTEFLGAINAVSSAAVGKKTGVDADTLDGLDSSELSLSGGSGGAQYNEDSVHANGSLGDFPLAVQTASATALGQNGDYVPFQTDSSGRLRVNADPITVSVTTTQDGEFYNRTCGWITGGLLISGPGGSVVSPSTTPSICVDAGGSFSPPACEPGDLDLGVDCNPTGITAYDGDALFVMVGECNRLCQR